jgi:hypothetical protein
LTVLLVVAWYTSGLGYLVSMVLSPAQAVVGGIAVGLLLGGVANGLFPPWYTLSAPDPLYFLDPISYTW